ncbi:quinone oxidoreductase [Nitratireductor sp. XY-223]|uniref:quinone oxidoreductase family protein n=1 Tax=Nitratireductor sp. XY-223 TaxID=2561926 RepID=UPI0010AA8186|nr:quinone oxidoreductase [Nitratireductor sp. XY-223]
MAYSVVASKAGGSDVLEVREIMAPIPGPGEVLLRHTAIGVNFIDTYFRTGLYPWPVDSDLVLGAEAAGVVEDVGRDVDGFSVGDRVAYVSANGAYASHRTIEASQLVRLPDNVSDETAAGCMVKGLTARYLLHDSFKVEKGHNVLFHAAAGGVGQIAGQWLAAMGIRAIGTAGGPEKCALALKHGYAQVIDYRSEDFVEKTRALVPDGVEVVYDSVGRDTYPGSLNCLKMHGTMVSFGQSSGVAVDFKLADLAAGSFHVTRPILFHFTALPGWLDRASSELFALIGEGTIKVDVNQTFGLRDAASAHDALEGRKTTGSTILIP